MTSTLYSVKYLIIHHSGVSHSLNSNQLKPINLYHKLKWNFKSSLGYYVGYHYVIDKGGTLTQTRAGDEQGIHCKGYNNCSLGICLFGNFNVERPTYEQTLTLRKLLKDLRIKFPKAKIKMHRDLGNTACPGKKITYYWMQEIILQNQTILMSYTDGSVARNKLLKRFEGKYIQRVEHKGEVYKIVNGKLIYYKGKKCSLFDEWSKTLSRIKYPNSNEFYLTGINEKTWGILNN